MGSLSQRLQENICLPPVVDDVHELLSVARSAQRLYGADVVRTAFGQRRDMVSLQCGFGVTAGQTSVTVTLAERCELIGGKTAQAGVFRGSPFSAMVGFG
jgi:hypothetical protein